MTVRLQDTIGQDLAAGEDLIRQGLAANATDQATLGGTPTQADVLSVVRRLLNREQRVMVALRALARWVD